MARQSFIGLVVMALLPLAASAKKSSIPPLAAYLTPPYSDIKFGNYPSVEPNQEEIPTLAPGQTVAFYLTRAGQIRSAYCSEESVQAVYPAESERTIAHFDVNTMVEVGRFQSDIASSSMSSGFASTKSNSVIEGVYTESEDSVAESTSSIAAVEMSSNLGQEAVTSELAELDLNTNMGEENASISARAETIDDNLGTEQSQLLVSETSDMQSSMASESDATTFSQTESEDNLLRTEADLMQQGAVASSSGQEAERARLLALEEAKRGGISGLLDMGDLSSIWDFKQGYGFLNEFGELNSMEFSDELLGVFRDAGEEFVDLLKGWDTLTLSDLLIGLSSEKIRKDAEEEVEGADPIYDLELRCSTKNVNSDNKIHFGGVFGMHTEVVNRGATVYELLILSAPPEDASFFEKPPEGTVGYVTEYLPQDNVVVTRVFNAIESGAAFRNLYATKADPWSVAQNRKN